jgi:alkylation response protein AidB-like acyl-CoA dehydrogenase
MAPLIIQGHKIMAEQPSASDFAAIFAITAQGPTVFLLEADHPGIRYDAENNEMWLENCQVGPESL